MKFGPRRGHFMFIFERFFRDFGLLIAALVISLILQDYQKLLENIPVLIVVLFAPVSRLIQYLFTYYSIDDEKLLVESGWLKKSKREIPLSNITTVDFTQNIFFQLAKVYSVNVDNAGSISGESAKVRMTFRIDDAVKVKKLLLGKPDNDSEDEIHGSRISEDSSGNTILASAADILIMGLLRSKMLIVVQVVTYGGVAVSLFAKVFLEKNVDGEDMLIDYLFHVSAPLLIMLLILALYLLGVAISVALTMLKYYGFRVTNRENSIFIEYGLLTKKTYTLMKEKISGVSYKQSLLMRAFGRGTVEVFAVGYGGTGENNEQEVAILYPVMKKARLYGFLERFLPRIKEREPYIKAQKRACAYFFLCGRFCCAVMILAAALMARPDSQPLNSCVTAGGILIFAAIAISVILEYKNAAIFGNEKLISLISGGYTKKTVFLRTDMVEYVEERASVRKRRKKITTIRLGVLSQSAVSRQQVRNVSTGAFERIKSKLVY